MNWKQKALYRLMSEISEDHWAAGWMSDNEFMLWEMMTDSEASREYGMYSVAESRLDELREISSELTGWIVFDHDPKFIPLSEWLPRFDAWLKEVNEYRKEIKRNPPPNPFLEA